MLFELIKKRILEYSSLKKTKISFLFLMLSFFLLSCDIKNKFFVSEIKGINNISEVKKITEDFTKYIIKGKVELPKTASFTTKANVNEILVSANVSLIYPNNHPLYPNKTVVSTSTKEDGFFNLEPKKTFQPKKGDVFILEVFKRYGITGTNIISLSTNVMWDGNTWKSITMDKITINTLTTAISIASNIEGFSFPLADTIEKILIQPNKTEIYRVGGLNKETVLDIEKVIFESLDANRDPLYSVKYKGGLFLC